MNKEKLKDLELEFLEYYPKGFESEELLPIMKKFNPLKLEEFAKTNLSKDSFSQPPIVCDNFMKVISKSVMVSLFDKAKLRDMIKSLTNFEKDILSIEIYELLYGDKQSGFEGLVEFLDEYKLAKWTIVSMVPYAIYRDKEYFIKPTTTKDILRYLEINELVYKPKPSFEFYDRYTQILNEAKLDIDKSLTFDNALFTGFLRRSIEVCENKVCQSTNKL